ncbi:MAG: MFS transporter [Cyanobacteria bacterium P01_D01_bin.105]
MTASTQQSATAPLAKSQLVFIFLTILIDKIGSSIIIPILPFLVGQFRDDALTLGFLTASFSVAQFLAIPVIGALSDRHGRRPVLLVCILGTTVAYSLFGIAGSLWVIYLSRLIDGITGGIPSTAQAYIADVSSPENRAKNFGITGAAFGLGFTIGPALGGFLAKFSLELPIFIAAALALLNFLWGYFSLPESLPVEKRQTTLEIKDFNPVSQLWRMFNKAQLRGLLLSFFLFNFVFTGFSSIYVLFLSERFGWGPTEAALVFVWIGVLSTLVQGGLIRKLLPRYGEAKLALTGIVLIALAFGLTLGIPKQGVGLYVGVYLTQAMLAFGVGFILPSLRALISNRVSDKEQGRTIAGTQSLRSVASIAGPIWAGVVFDHLGILSPFWMGGVMMVVALGITVVGLRQEGTQPCQ